MLFYCKVCVLITENRKYWNEAEVAALKVHMKHFFDNKKVPRQQDCKDAMAKSPLLANISWKAIKMKIYNMAVAKKD